MNAVIRDGFLYTCQHIGLSGTNGIYVGNELGTNVDRSGVQWLKLEVITNGMLSYHKHGRVYDAAPTNALYYYFPSVAVNCASDILLGFSGSSSNQYISAYYAWRPANGVSAEPPVLFHAGMGYYSATDQWGDYSFTSLDPTDSLSFWTGQEFATEEGLWGTWIAKIKAR